MPHFLQEIYRILGKLVASARYEIRSIDLKVLGYLDHKIFFSYLFSFEIRSHIVQAGLKYVTYLKMALYF